jgi:hypothetical protein
MYKKGPLTQSENKKKLTELTAKLGWNPEEFSNYSFRRGGATSLGERVPEGLLKAAGRWR